jgi:hypothetical protein
VKKIVWKRSWFAKNTKKCIGRDNMAWIIGLANDKEIDRILRAGYEVHDDKLMPDIGFFATPDGISNDRGIAVYVDCDVHELLNLTEEN